MRTRLLIVMASLLASGCSLVPQEQAPRKAAVARSAAPVVVGPEAQACMADLGSRSAGFTPLPDTYYGAGCSAVGAVKLASLRSDTKRLRLSNLGPMTCTLADTFAGWARFGVDRAAQQILGSPVVKIETMGTYNCRNIAGSARLSGHARAQAIDVSGFVLADGRRITVEGNWDDKSPEVRRFFTAIHASACKRFGMVLGPDYNPAHRNHLHLEVGGRKACR
ncbi:MAG: extensin family protein [Sphingomonadales bacterium]|nr:extensin family protein [Sphingomonadales bacterium]